MGLFDRMSRAVSANFNALLDGLEDPKKDVEQTILDMENALRKARADIVSAVAAEKQLKKKVEELGGDVERWGKRAELAVTHADDELARDALRQKRRVEDERDRAEKYRVEQRGAALELRTELERMERTVDEVKAKRGIFAARLGQARAGGGVEGLGARPGGNAFSEFRRMEDQLEGVEASIAAEKEVAEALGGSDKSPGGLSREEVEARFRKLEAERGGSGAGADVDEELRVLKTKLRV
ncbi:MAG TPA: PspA/IM30 family protein [Polyangiaceae bacterium]|jgi:phage shock protein A|nr:PspA/IM30 family protein [Polyangiaceae bacterium]